MRDSSYPLRKAYITALGSLTYNSADVPVYYQEAPDTETAENYVVINSVNHNDGSGKHLSETESSVTLTIHTFDSKYNSGKAADDIASLILTAIYPNRQTNLDLSADSMQCIKTVLASDNIQDYAVEADRKYVDRTLIFRHTIFQR